MNKDRRKAIDDVIAALTAALNTLDPESIETIRDEEQDYFDNMPESLQGGDKGQAAEAAVEHLTDAFDKVEDAANALQEAIEALGEAMA